MSKSSDEWYNVINDVQSEFDQANEDGYLFKALLSHRLMYAVRDTVGASFETNIIAKWSIVGPQIHDCELKSVIQKIVDIKADAPRINADHVSSMCNMLGVNTSHIAHQIDNICADLRAEYSKYELFGMFDWGRCVGSIRDHVIKYINSVDTTPEVSDNDQRLAA